MSILQTRRQRVVKAGTGITVTNAGNNATVAIDAAVQADQETGSSTAKVVVPGVQQFHPSAAKWWGIATVATGTPTLQASYNVTSITDSGVGILTWTIGADFSSANWSYTGGVVPNAANAFTQFNSLAAGSIIQLCIDISGPVAHDPTSWSAGGFGDQ